MTAPVLDDEVLAKGRELVTGNRLPSKRELQKHLAKGWPVVNEVLSRLDEEVREAGARRSREARRTLRRLSARKRFGSARPSFGARQRTVNDIALKIDAAPMPEPVAELVTEAVQERAETPAVAVNESRPRAATWPIYLLALPAFVAIWSGWVDLGRLTGFGMVRLLPGIADDVQLNTAITLPIGLETYAAYALYVWLSGVVPARARQFAKYSAIGSLALGAAGQVAYHLMVAAGMDRAPWQITTVVACLPVAVLGMGAALRHLVHAEDDQ